MPRPLLYTYRRCPYAMRARMALLQAGVAFDSHEIVLRDKPRELLRLSPKGTVPVLALPDGAVIEESLDIMRWAFEAGERGAGAAWWQRAQSPDCQALVALNDGPFKQALDRYKYPERYPMEGRQELHRDGAVSGLLQALEAQLARQLYLGGDAPCAADIAIFPFVRQFRAVDADWFDQQPLPATQRWLGQWLESELFQSCMRKLPTGATVAF